MSNQDRALALNLRRVAILSWRLLNRGERTVVGALAVAMLINSALQTFSLALLIPFVGLLLDPAAVLDNPRLAPVREFLGNPPHETLLILCSAALLAAFILKNVFDLGYNLLLNRLIARVESRVSTDLLSRCMNAPYEWFLTRSTSLLLNSVMAHVTAWARTGLKSVLSLTSNGVLLISILTLLITINPIFGLALAAIGALLAVVILGVMKPHIRRLARSKQIGNDQSVRHLLHALNGFKDIQINSRTDFFVRQYTRWHRHFTGTNARLATIQPIPNYAIEIAMAAMLVGVGIFAAMQPELRTEIISVLAIYGVATIRMVPVFNQVNGTISAIHGAVPAIENITEIEAELAAIPILPVSTPGDRAAFADWRQLRLDNVGYNYPTGGRAAVTSIDLSIDRGTRLGVVGRSGAGKTTLIDLISGLLAADQGRLTVDGTPLSAKNARAWRHQLGYVPQHPFIADDTLRFNVALDSEAVDDERVMHALAIANLRTYIEQELPQGLDTQLGDHGVRLSGGQRQRVAIARALFHDPSLLIFDEATSSLDAESERAISSALDHISREKTIIIIAHRLSTVMTCDRILVLDGGAVIACDSHRNLLRDCALYRHFVELGDLSTTSAANASDDAIAAVGS